MSARASGLRLGPLAFHDGVEGRHLAALFFVAFLSVPISGFINIAQPYVLTEILRIPFDQQGSLTGQLLVMHELVNLSVIGIYGAASDKLGRRPLLATAFGILAAGYCLFPLVTGQTELVVFRLLLACGVGGVTAMLSAVANDYPLEHCRARMIAAVFMCNGLGLAILPRVFGGLPAWFGEQGHPTADAARFAFLIVAGVAVMAALAAGLGLRPGAPAQIGRREPLLATLRVGLAAARNPRIALAYAAGLVSRGDLSVASTFLTLWLMREGVSRGLTPAEALRQATFIYIVIQASALPWAAVLGYVLDRIDRVLGLMLAMALAALGYGSLALIDNPLGGWMYASAALLGMGEMAALLSAMSLVGRESPEQGRGAVMGMFSMCGAAGIILVGAGGGPLFDHWRPTGPFLMVAAANVVLFIAAAGVFIAGRRRAAAASAAAG
jgi:MFS family permease